MKDVVIIKIENHKTTTSNFLLDFEVNHGINNMSEVHLHNTHELYYLTHGNINYFIAQETYEVKSGDIVIIPAGIPHKTNMLSEKRERILIHFNDECIMNNHIKEFLQEQRVYSANSNIQDELINILSKIDKEYCHVSQYSNELIKYYLNILLLLLHRDKNIISNKRIDNKAIYNAEEYIKQHYAEKLTLESLAQNAFLSKSYFSRTFNKYTGISVSDYISLVRIQKAKEMICSGSKSIIEISQKCGFNDSNYFSTVFKKITGVSPYQYYKKQNSNNRNLTMSNDEL